ncbi:MAG: hypothetical protein IVW53_12905 [Chloroflexi bacterium]|nr:hypothetical protein [Chloroflexota bacterium]
MGAIVRLASDAASVAPGAEAAIAVTIRNSGTVVDQFAIDVLGDAGAWSHADPRTLSLFPGAEGTTTVRFAPPRSPSAAAGTIPFGVRVQSREDPAGSAVEEGALTVEPFADTFAELLPRTSRGSRTGSHDVAVDNRGNTRLNATIAGSDPDQLLDFDVRPPGIVVPAGTAGFARVNVRPRRRFWRGTPRSRAFRVAVSAPEQPPLTLDGTLVQEPILPSWFLRAVAALIGLLILALVLWLLVLQPAIRSAATQALVDAGITPVAGGGGGGGGGSGGGAGSPTPSGAIITPAPSGSGPTATLAPGGTFGGHLVDGRLSVDGTNPTGVTPSKTTLYVTDLVFANPNGRAGTMDLTRGSVILMELRLENFRDLDYHFVTPIVVSSGKSLVVSVTCTSSGPCDPSVYYSGFTNP